MSAGYICDRCGERSRPGPDGTNLPNVPADWRQIGRPGVALDTRSGLLCSRCVRAFMAWWSKTGDES